MHDNQHLYMWIKMAPTNTGTDTLTLAFTEALFDKTASFEWLNNASAAVSTPIPMMQVLYLII